mmetsp:Transcript_72698/g.210469  ORF Transcript_72698/g.210469 Transcript_72698/m.210469 type:complete len:319 (+) Transcript_72698:277-1233(+)
MYKHCGGVGPGRPADSSAAIQADLLWLLSLQARDGLQLRGRGACVLLRSSSDRLPHPVNFDGELDRVDRRLRAEVVHAGLQAELPAVEVHGGQLRRGGVHHVDVQRLGLVDVGPPVGRHVEDRALLDLPDGLVQGLDLLGEVQVLHAAVVRDEAHPHVLRPQAQLDQVAEEVAVDLHKLAGHDPAHVEVLRVGLEGLAIAQDLRRTRCGHRRHEQRVAHAMLGNLRLQAGPVPSPARRRLAPKVELQHASARRGALEALVGAVARGQLARGLTSREVDGLEDVGVQALRLLGLEREPHHHEHVREALNAQAHRAMPHV